MTSLLQLDLRSIPLPAKAVFWICFFVLLLIPFRIHTFNYRPPDDANRHVAKAISGKDWPEILVMDSRFTALDHNQGWHWMLRRLHQLGWDAETLLLVSSIGLFLLVVLTGLFRFHHHPLSWVAAFGLLPVVNHPGRLTMGRPFLISSTVLLILLGIWSSDHPPVQRRRWITTVLLIAFAGWVHGAWYLFALLPLSLLLSGKNSQALQAGLCWLGGSILAGILNGSPLLYLLGQIRQTWASVDTADVSRLLVTEFRPVFHFAVLLLLLGTALIWKKTRGSLNSLFAAPAFWMTLICWILGLVNGRFWYDWGTISLLFLIAQTLSGLDGERFGMPVPLHQNALLTGLLAGGVFLLFTTDINSRWSNADFLDPLRLEDPEHTGWLPDPGGILYSDSMQVYYQTFFHNPHADWKYMLGHEAALMPPEDLEVYRSIRFYGQGAEYLFDPWVRKMTPADRLILRRSVEPGIEGLEWKKVAYQTWAGRLPREDEESESL